MPAKQIMLRWRLPTTGGLPGRRVGFGIGGGDSKMILIQRPAPGVAGRNFGPPLRAVNAVGPARGLARQIHRTGAAEFPDTVDPYFLRTGAGAHLEPDDDIDPNPPADGYQIDDRVAADLLLDFQVLVLQEHQAPRPGRIFRRPLSEGVVGVLPGPTVMKTNHLSVITVRAVD